ncbi:MAG: extracellular solute-binding protein, partial [Clostridiales bacterium]|nr:extracellular solute-binding protein [Clostridiales bacterium]
MRKILTLLLALVMSALPALAGSEPMKSTEMDQPVKFSYLRPVWSAPTYEKGNDYEKMLFEAGNVEIDASIIAVADFDAKLPVLIAGGTDIDVMWNMGANNAVMRDIIGQGAFLALDDLLAKYPDVRDAVYPATWDLLTSDDGKHYFFPAPLAVFVPFPIYYRTDVFAELGLEIPTTIDEFTDCLRAIKAAKPDMIPLTVNELFSYWYFQNVANAFGFNFGWMPDPADETRIIPSNISEQFRNFLLWMHTLRQEGLIDPDHMIAAGKLGADTFKAGNAAVIAINWNSYQS